MNPDKNEDSTLSNGWILCSSKSIPGRKYYFNRKTGKSSWTKPQEGESSSTDKRTRKKVKEKEKEQINMIMNDLLKVPKESPKKMKRKSHGSSTQNTSPRKQHDEGPTTCKQNKKQKLSPEIKLNSIKARTPSKKGNSSSTLRKPSPKITPPKSSNKNIAKARMAQLRADLSNESIEVDKSSPRKSPNTSQTETKSAKVELKSPNMNDSKCSMQSPINDSLQSVPSPSQFFAANKIISSMKAQLPEEYNQKEKPKDTFADIEQGICNQVTEYPYMKHPATPPQFSQASKLLSAIKSKLSYKADKEAPITFTTANDRLQAFRKSLGGEEMDVTVEKNESLMQYSNEAMEVDHKEMKQNVPVLGNIQNHDSSSKENIVLVVDTNVFIKELDLIKNVMNSHIKGFAEPPTLLVPWRVINELDKLKDSNNGNGAICKRARPAMDYLYKYLPENDRIKVQPLRDANSHIYPCESPDDEILNCCLQQAEKGKSVILLSNDKNLCIKAAANGVQNKKLRELQLEPTAEPRAQPDEAMRVQKHIYTLLANILENEMRIRYDNIWPHVVFKPPPWTLIDVLQCLLKHWMAVFQEVFPRIEHLITELKDSLTNIENKGSKNITQSQLINFKEQCLDVAKHCQIIPEYMALAKKTVARLQRPAAGDSDDEGGAGEGGVIQAFEGVWTVFSSYCAKLASGLGVAHNVEDKLSSDDTLEVLTSKLELFDNHICALTLAMEGLLPESLSEEALEEHSSVLQAALGAALAALGVPAAPPAARDLRTFGTKCRIMLQEAHSKFSQLVDLLQICKNTIVVSS